MKLGIVGLPNVGKSTLFNSLTQAEAESANYPFCTIVGKFKDQGWDFKGKDRMFPAYEGKWTGNFKWP